MLKASFFVIIIEVILRKGNKMSKIKIFGLGGLNEYGKNIGKDFIPLGLDFGTIDPVMVNIREDQEIAFIAKKKENYELAKTLCNNFSYYSALGTF